MPGPTHEIQLSAAPLGTWHLWSAAPSPNLSGSVKEYWEVQGQLAPFREMVLPNGCVEVMINLGPPHEVLSEQGLGIWDRSWFSGLQRHAIRIESLNGTHLVSARLHPLGAAELLGPGVAASAGAVVDLESMFGKDAHELHNAIRVATSPSERFELLERFLEEGRHRGRPVPAVVRGAANAIESAHGNLQVSSLHEALGVSRKHLSVSFTEHTGVSAKTYAQIHRFMWTLAQLREHEDIDWSTLALDAGYSDQSHLARDFKRIGAATPREYLRRRTPDGMALIDD